MFRVPFSEALAILGSVLAIVLIVLDKAGKLKGPMLLILLAVAAVLTLPLALSCPWVRDASPRMPQFSRGMLMVFLVGVIYSIIAVWISGSATPPQQDVSAPNIDCLGEDDLFVELKRDIFRESETYGHGLRAVTGKIQNKPCPPKRIASIDKVKAQISYYGFDFPDKRTIRTSLYRYYRASMETAEASESRLRSTLANTASLAESTTTSLELT